MAAKEAKTRLKLNKLLEESGCRFVTLSNGNLHYFWDLEQGNPHIIAHFPLSDSIKAYHHQI